MSLISAIKDAIFNETPADVTINERSFISIMLDSSNDESLKKDDLYPHFSKYFGKSLMLTRIFIQILIKTVLLIIFLVYVIYNIIHVIVTGRWRGLKSSSGINLIIGSTVLVATIVTILYILTFLTKEIVFSPNNAIINNQGVVTVDQPCLETHSFFLLNSANFWTSTGIQVSDGDNVSITASGSMYSDIGDMYNAADSNRMLKYPRSIFTPGITTKKDNASKYCIYGRYKDDTTSQFGSLLYQISTSHKGPVLYNDSINKNVIKQMDFSKNNIVSFKADKSGVLYLAFNDILLDRDIYERIRIDSATEKAARDLCSSLKRRNIHSINDIVPQNEKIWFQDNIGEVLVNVRIEKDIDNSDFPWYKKILLLVYRDIDHSVNQSFFESNLGKFVKYLSFFLLFDILISFFIKCCIQNRQDHQKKDGNKR